MNVNGSVQAFRRGDKACRRARYACGASRSTSSSHALPESTVWALQEEGLTWRPGGAAPGHGAVGAAPEDTVRAPACCAPCLRGRLTRLDDLMSRSAKSSSAGRLAENLASWRARAAAEGARSGDTASPSTARRAARRRQAIAPRAHRDFSERMIFFVRDLARDRTSSEARAHGQSPRSTVPHGA